MLHMVGWLHLCPDPQTTCKWHFRNCSKIQLQVENRKHRMQLTSYKFVITRYSPCELYTYE